MPGHQGGGAGQRVQRGSGGRGGGGHAAGGIDHVAPALHTAAGTNVNALLVYNERSKVDSLPLAEKALLLREAMADVVEVAGGVARFFRTFDADGDHLLSPSELRRGMNRNGLKLSKRDAEVVARTFGGVGLNMGGLSRILSGSASDALTRSHEVAARARAASAAASTRASHGGGGFDHVTGALHTDAGRLESAHEAWNSSRGSTLSATQRDAMLHQAIGDVVDTCGGVKKFVHAYGLHNGRELSARELENALVRNGLKVTEGDAARVVGTFGGSVLHMSELMRLIDGVADSERAAAERARQSPESTVSEARHAALLRAACAEAVEAAGGALLFFRACGAGRRDVVVAEELVRCFARFGLTLTHDDATRIVGGGSLAGDRINLGDFSAVMSGSAPMASPRR